MTTFEKAQDVFGEMRSLTKEERTSIYDGLKGENDGIEIKNRKSN